MPKPEFAPGIPASRAIKPIPRVREPVVWDMALQRHEAERAGTHYDLRLGDPQGRAHSWALRQLPAPGERRLAVQQATHTVPYMSFQGTIESGYGKGKVELADQGKAEVLRAGGDELRFNLYKGKENQEFLLRRMKPGQANWLIQNVTPSRSVGPTQALPSSKPSYKKVDIERVDISDPNTELQAKIDGAHVLYQFKSPGSMPRVFSYRPTERATGIIDHTHKLPDFHQRKTPLELKDTILRGELYASDRQGKALSAARVGGILNAGVWNSREKQQQEGRLIPVAFDIVKWRGKDVSNLPYAEKRQLLTEATRAAPWLQRPRTATTPEEKKRLIEDIRTGKEPSTEEGVVEWHNNLPTPRKSKFLEERDVYVRKVFAEQGVKRQGTMAGGFEFSYTPTGPTIGRVGTGMSHEMKTDMLRNPVRYQGLHARIAVQKAPAQYAPRAPSFLGFHLDQDLPENIKTSAKESPVNPVSIVKEAKVLGGFYQGKPTSPDSVKFVMNYQGLKIKIDRPKGFVMLGKDSKGKEWRRQYKVDYGFIPKTLGGDKDGLDIFIGPRKTAKDAFWVVQRKDDGSFDEYKVMLGFGSREDAKACYDAHIPRKFFGRMIVMSVEMMKAMLGTEPNEQVKKACISALAEIEGIEKDAVFERFAPAAARLQEVLAPYGQRLEDVVRNVPASLREIPGEVREAAPVLQAAYQGAKQNVRNITHDPNLAFSFMQHGTAGVPGLGVVTGLPWQAGRGAVEGLVRHHAGQETAEQLAKKMLLADQVRGTGAHTLAPAVAEKVLKRLAPSALPTLEEGAKKAIKGLSGMLVFGSAGSVKKVASCVGNRRTESCSGAR